jgi:hypothetical protein
MTEETGSPPPGEQHCSGCGAAVNPLASYCSSCGRPLGIVPPEVDIGGWVQTGWRLFTGNVATAIGLCLLLVVPVFMTLGLLYFGGFGLVFFSTPGPEVPKTGLVVVASVMGTGVLLLVLLLPAMRAGIMACFLDGMRTGKLTTGKLWVGFRHWWACTWVSWLLGLALLISLPFNLILIGIPISLGINTLLWLALFHIGEQERGGGEALAFAWNALRGRFWPMILSTLLVGLMMGAGAMAMYFGVIVTVPLGLASFAAGYDALSRQSNLRQ